MSLLVADSSSSPKRRPLRSSLRRPSSKAIGPDAFLADPTNRGGLPLHEVVAVGEVERHASFGGELAEPRGGPSVPSVIVEELVAFGDVPEGHQVDPVVRRGVPPVHRVGRRVVVEAVSGDPHPEKPVVLVVVVVTGRNRVPPLVGVLVEPPEVVLDVFQPGLVVVAVVINSAPVAAEILDVPDRPELLQVDAEDAPPEDRPRRDALPGEDPGPPVLRRSPLDVDGPPLFLEREPPLDADPVVPIESGGTEGDGEVVLRRGGVCSAFVVVVVVTAARRRRGGKAAQHRCRDRSAAPAHGRSPRRRPRTKGKKTAAAA
mmetsp:Transcript_20841/g.49306  ORF Transcript_20841/g.49306 Transcript_20841/m.49306 type:complete len:317 (-) Transcript_20841:23-973(-)